MYERRMLGLDDADRIVEAIIAHTRQQQGLPISIAVVDYRGDLIKFIKMDGASWNSVRMAQAKAYSAAKFRRDTSTLAALMAERNVQISDWADPNVTSLGGGVCIWDEKASPRVPLGAVAVSGWPQTEVDEAYAKIGAAALS